MAKTSDQIEIVARRKKGTKTEEEEKKKKKKNQSLSQSSNKGNNNTTTTTTTTTKKRKKKSDKNESQNKDEYEGIVVPDSQDENGDEFVEDSYEDHANKEEKSNGVANQRSKKAKNGKEKTDLVTTTTKKKNIKNKEEEESESGCGSGSTTGNCFPMYRMNRMIKSEDPDIRIYQESVFLINKASEKFLELFCEEAYACAFLDHKNHVSYKHLSTVVSKRKRFDFLSDFVPEKVKAEDAIAEVPVAET